MPRGHYKLPYTVWCVLQNVNDQERRQAMHTCNVLQLVQPAQGWGNNSTVKPQLSGPSLSGLFFWSQFFVMNIN